MKNIHHVLIGLCLLAVQSGSLLAAAPGDLATIDPVEPDEVGSGSLLARTDTPVVRYIPLPGLETRVRVSVTGIAAHVEVSQTFRNPSTRWLEAIYVFPLPADSAVTHLRMELADRIIEGVVREKHEARAQYTRAKREGRKASLVEQQRPNLFTSSVANIPPGEAITITLSYLETVSRTDDAYSLRVPLVAGPRYTPPATGPGILETGGADAVPVKNPNTVPPVFGRVNPVTISFELDAGFEIDTVQSSYHRMEITRAGESRAAGRLAGRRYADRDFELRWRPVVGAAPRVAAFVDTQGDEDYLLLMFQPPLPDVSVPATPRELILVIDASGSMHGDSIEQALAAARFALSTLGKRDRFNLIRFSDAPTMLFPAPQPAGPDALARAETFLSRIDANGGTNIAAALRRAFNNPRSSGTLRQLVFLTDGAVGNESELFSMIADGTRASRLFTVGIGSAPNGYFMRRAARAGRGTYTFIGRSDEVQSRMAALFERIGKPALTDIRIDWLGAATPPEGGRVPDLYYGEPLTLTARVRGFRGLDVNGRYGQHPWRATIAADAVVPAPWVSTLWARDRIRQLKDDLLGGGDRDRIKTDITRIGLDHQLVTPYTSLVAVEHRVSRDPSDPLYRADVPANLPEGWSYRHVFGSLPQTAAGWQGQLLAGLVLALLGLLLLWSCRARRSSPAPC